MQPDTVDPFFNLELRSVHGRIAFLDPDFVGAVEDVCSHGGVRSRPAATAHGRFDGWFQNIGVVFILLPFLKRSRGASRQLRFRTRFLRRARSFTRNSKPAETVRRPI